MSTIKSSDEHLTLNADGSSKDIKFQANGVEKASISSSGAFTSTTIDATKLTGDLPAISGANLTGVGVAGITSSADATAMTITSDEKIGIGEASPTAARLHITTNDQGTLPSLQADADDVVIENSTPGITLMGATNGGGMLAFGDTADADVGRIFYYHVNNNMDFVTNGDTRLSLRNDGQLISYVPAGSSRTNMSFYNGGVIKGSIVTSDYTNNTTYNTSSDYRLKENVDYDWDATTRLKQLKPARFNWIADDTNTLFDGFIAHEVQDIIPEAITGEKDAMTTNENGDAVIAPQGIDQSKLVPLLVKTIQELEARIAALES